MYKNELDPRDKTYLDAAWHRWRVIGIMAIALIPLNVLGAEVSGPGTVTLSSGQKWESVAYTLNTSHSNKNDSRAYLYFGQINRALAFDSVPSSDGLYYGFAIAKDVIMYWEGTLELDGWVGDGVAYDVPSEKPKSNFAIKYDRGLNSFTQNECNLVSKSTVKPCKGMINSSTIWALFMDPRFTFVSRMEYRINVKVGVYVGPNANPGTYNVPEVSLSIDNNRTEPMMKAGVVKVIPPMECTINTPPLINFGKVNSWDWEGNTSGTPGGKLGDVLKVVDGDFVINCTGDGNRRASATLTLDGKKGRYTDDLQVTMDETGEVAPASVRVTIKDLKPPCSSGLSWVTVAGKPTANVAKLDDLVPGNNQVPYRFSLCSTGQGFKGGAASASAIIKLDWE
ncbi:hypothetical protein MNY64_17930 (plasmid) [Moellerella wisconsensis]|uniref:hypothetical protein n=1 Tax=Moellerella wisconsensis TaxID=158849 RepID=UPI001F4D5C11|nr:hypothetical protein [Moellerella wisconsensis]UNH29212.1 hypothetical protein MNY64_17930 [Moellerella wisconsensis]